MCSSDLGSNPPDLMAAGASGNGQGFVARWTGSAWSMLASNFNAAVRALTVHDDDDDGPRPISLFCGGDFSSQGGTPLGSVARWNGSSWEQVGAGLSASVYCLRAFDLDGVGVEPARLVVAGSISSGSVAIWDGGLWTLPAGSPDRPSSGQVGGRALAMIDPDGVGPRETELVVGGASTHLGGSPGVLYTGLGAWDGLRWGPLGNEFVEGRVIDFCLHDPDGSGPAGATPFACGTFTAAGGQKADGLAMWTGSGWLGLGERPASMVDPRWLYEIASIDLDAAGPNPATLVGIDSRVTAPSRVLRWNGAAWTALGTLSGSGQALTLMPFDPDGPGPSPTRLFVAGSGLSPSTLVMWNGLSWVRAGTTTQSERFMTLFRHDPDGPGPEPEQLYAAGDFRLLRWAGQDWVPVATMTIGNDQSIWKGVSWDSDGAGPATPEIVIGALLVGTAQGSFYHAAAFDGLTW